MTKPQPRAVFVHGAGKSGAAAWPVQHWLAADYDCIFLNRHGFAAGDQTDAQLSTDFAEDERLVLENVRGSNDGAKLHRAMGGGTRSERGAADPVRANTERGDADRDDTADGGVVVAHSAGAVAAMMAAVASPSSVRGMVLCEPACFSLTRDLPATSAHIAAVSPIFDAAGSLTDLEFSREFGRAVFGAKARDADPDAPGAARRMRRLRLSKPPWCAPLSLVPGVPTLVLSGGWEPLYEEVADYLAETGAEHRTVGGQHRPQDTEEGAELIRKFIGEHA